jgi:hypothetical protein
VGAASRVVVGEAAIDIVREADIEARPGVATPENVDTSLVFGHV